MIFTLPEAKKTAHIPEAVYGQQPVSFHRPRGVLPTSRFYVPEKAHLAVERKIFRGEEWYQIRYKIKEEGKLAFVSPKLEILDVTSDRLLNHLKKEGILAQLAREEGITEGKELDEIMEEAFVLGWNIDIAEAYKVVSRYNGKTERGYFVTPQSSRFPPDFIPTPSTMEATQMIIKEVLGLTLLTDDQPRRLMDYRNVCFLLRTNYDYPQTRRAESPSSAPDSRKANRILNGSESGKLLGKPYVEGKVLESLSRGNVPRELSYLLTA